MVTTIEPIIPYALGFAAGAKLFVAIRHIISHIKKSKQEIWRSIRNIRLLMMMILEIILV